MKTFNITVNGTPYSVTAEETNGAAPMAPAAPVAPAAPAAAPAAPAPAAAPGRRAGARSCACPPLPWCGVCFSAPMPGTILDVKVRPPAPL